MTYIIPKIRAIGICGLFCLCLCLSLSCRDNTEYRDGVYYGETEGYYSTIVVSVEIIDGHIDSIDIISHEEPIVLANIVFEELPPKMIKKNSYDVDVISGATYTSKSVIGAVENALKDALGGE
ncbi:MAG: FMN-binding protein [Vallitaleaceae bacterium]|jgi:NosR/NirI family nitrous oxide reductase transcriptional regulator|nr:FMN-binding protein [Vallitaleaceae bacterium]